MLSTRLSPRWVIFIAQDNPLSHVRLTAQSIEDKDLTVDVHVLNETKALEYLKYFSWSKGVPRTYTFARTQQRDDGTVFLTHDTFPRVAGTLESKMWANQDSLRFAHTHQTTKSTDDTTLTYTDASVVGRFFSFSCLNSHLSSRAGTGRCPSSLTNNPVAYAEAYAVHEAVSNIFHTKDSGKHLILTDNKFVVKLVQQLLRDENVSGDPATVRLARRIVKKIKKFEEGSFTKEIRVSWVKGHSKDELNQLADSVCRGLLGNRNNTFEPCSTELNAMLEFLTRTRDMGNIRHQWSRSEHVATRVYKKWKLPEINA